MADNKEETRVSKIVDGSTVRLKSGGPLMTVTSVGSDLGVNSAWVTWFADNKQQTSVIALSALEVSED